MFTALWAQVLYALPISDARGCVPVHFNQCERQCLHLRIHTCAFALCTKKGFEILESFHVWYKLNLKMSL